MNPTAQAMQNWKLTLAYDGTDYAGWQVQPGLPTVQGELAAAIARVVDEQVLPQGAGRTDAGVHAEGQVASFRLQAAIPGENLLRALNRVLPQAIRVIDAQPAPEEFHARHSACAKTYIYTLYRGEICPPFVARYVYRFPAPLSFEAMQQAAALVEGEHDFTSFAAHSPDLAARSTESEDGPPMNYTRRIFSSSWKALDGERWQYRVRGNGFLHHMVRNLVGTYIDVGRGRIDAAGMLDILSQRDRSAAGATAPAQGLLLHNVEYGDPAKECEA
jgi:tRNA pseudouridine38-40 synthase